MNLDVAVQLKHPGWKRLLRPYCKTVREICRAALSETKLAKISRRFEMTVILADDAFIRELNRDYRGHDKPTNVLSFPNYNPERAKRGAGSRAIDVDPVQAYASQDYSYLGDVIMAYETVEREALEQAKNAKQHAIHLLVHGTLHLLGFDHVDKKDALRMENLEIKILKKQKINNPYL